MRVATTFTDSAPNRDRNAANVVGTGAVGAGFGAPQNSLQSEAAVDQ